MEEVVVDTGSDSFDPGAHGAEGVKQAKRRSAHKSPSGSKASEMRARMASLSGHLASESLACVEDFDPAVGDGL